MNQLGHHKFYEGIDNNNNNSVSKCELSVCLSIFHSLRVDKENCYESIRTSQILRKKKIKINPMSKCEVKTKHSIINVINSTWQTLYSSNNWVFSYFSGQIEVSYK